MKDLTDYEKIEFLISKMKTEGFEYCFEHYSKWEHIKDKKFHRLRKEYLESRSKLEKRISKLRLKYLEKEL